jgi:hypothetical protein
MPEPVYLKAYESVSAARADIADYIGWFNTPPAFESGAAHAGRKVPGDAAKAGNGRVR